MTNILDLTKCTSTEEICEELEKVLNEAEIKAEQPKRKSIFVRVSGWVKQLFHK